MIIHFPQVSRDYKKKLLLWKRYFDVGYSLTNYMKYAFVVFGWATADVKSTIGLIILYCIGCFFLGWYWLNSDFYELDVELSNKYNPFVKKMLNKRFK